MSKGRVLITDTLFIADEHVKQIEDAGYEVQRLDKTNATEDELIQALQADPRALLPSPRNSLFGSEYCGKAQEEQDE